MRRDKDTFDSSQPALLVTYGNTAKKFRQLDSDLIVLGRSTLCDINLVSPEVAPVHCLLVRVAEGWKLRDCCGRPGTRVNGKPVQEILIDDGDIIQVGAFSFQAHLPTGHTPHASLPPIPPELVDRLRRSRRQLIERVLHYRKETGERLRGILEGESRLAAERKDLQGRSETIRARERDYQLRMTRLELSERDLVTDRATLEREYRTLHEEAERHAASVRLANEEAARRNQEAEQRQHHLNSQASKVLLPSKDSTESVQVNEDEHARKLEIRALELKHFAAHLHRQQHTLPKQVPMVSAPAEPAVEMERLLAELRETVRELRGGEREELEQFRRDNEELRQRLAERSGEWRREPCLRDRVTVSGP